MMEIKNKETALNDLIINKVPSKSIYEQMIQDGKVNDNELYLIQEEYNPFFKYVIKAAAGQSSFTLPIEIQNTNNLNVFYNGLLLIETVNYSISNNIITLLGFTAEANDYIVAFGLNYN